MQDNYLKKIDRVTAILMHLQSRRIVRAHDLAVRFEVSLRTIYRDIRTLENAGIPIVSEAGVGYSLMDGYKLPPVMFTREEVFSFITAEKFMQNFSDKELGRHYESAIVKVKSVLNTSDKQLIQQIEQQIDVFNDYSGPKKAYDENRIGLILESISQKKQVKIDYQSALDQLSERCIDPIGLFFEYNHWYTMAYCHLRQAIRQFRLDRIAQIQQTNIPFLEQYGHISHYRNTQKTEAHRVIILVDQSMKPYLVNSKYYFGLIQEVETDHGIEMTFETQWLDEGFPRWIISFGDYVRIIEPQTLKESVQQLLQKITAKLNT